MNIVVGLGNPGKEYSHTRHNAGFVVLDALREKLNGSVWTHSNEFESEISEADVDGRPVVLMKPQTFMNNSGRAVQHVMQYFKVQPEHLFVAYDDADLPLGVLRIRLDGGSGGHNGLYSVIEHAGTDQFPHFRIGISSPVRDERKIEARDFVLGTFTAEEKKILAGAIERSVSALQDALTGSIAQAMNKWNS